MQLNIFIRKRCSNYRSLRKLFYKLAKNIFYFHKLSRKRGFVLSIATFPGCKRPSRMTGFAVDIYK